MAALFFYGTLQHIPLLEIVLGRSFGDIKISNDQLRDHVVLAVAEGPFPCIEAASGQFAAGVLVEGLSARDVDRLNFYEGSFASDLREMALVSGHKALVYFAHANHWSAVGPWSLNRWQAVWGDLSCFAAIEVMDYFGRYSVDQVAKMFPMIRTRAAAMVNARQSRHGGGTLQGRVEIDRIDRVYTNYFALNEYHLSHERTC